MYPPDLIDLLLQHTRHSSTKIAELGHFLIENAVNLCRKHELEEVEEDDSATLSSLSSPSLSPSPRSPPPPLLSSFKHFSSNPTLVLVGAGPGDPSLMTLAAVDCLRQATLIIKDGLIPPSFISEILGDHHYSTSSSSYSSKSHIHHHLNANEFFFSLTPTIKTVNKECGRAHTAQGEIHQWILEEVLKTSPSYTPFIVRLKGGDPFIFGRGGEEIQVLYSHLLDQYKRHRNHPSDDHVIDSYDYHCNFKESIEQLITSLRIKIIPGISSSLSAPLAALIPPTHRGTSDQIFISTGRKERDGVMPGKI